MDGQMQLDGLEYKLAQLTRLHGFASGVLDENPEATWDAIVAGFWKMEEGLDVEDLEIPAK